MKRRTKHPYAYLYLQRFYGAMLPPSDAGFGFLRDRRDAIDEIGLRLHEDAAVCLRKKAHWIVSVCFFWVW